jgi:hypothetical protein
MNRLIFSIKNISDKSLKMIHNPDLLKFYVQTYILSKFESVEPDTYVVSYPKCGRTWLRVLTHKYLERCGLQAHEFRDKSLMKIPGNHILKFEHDKSSWVPAPCSMKNLNFDTKKYTGKKIVFLVRDPRDVLVSSWYHLKFRENVYTGSLSEFIRDDLVGIRKLVAFMNMWIENSHIPDSFTVITYEDLHRDSVVYFSDFLKFLDININHEALGTAIEESTFRKMKEMELHNKLNEPWMKPGSKQSANSMKIRKGSVGGYKNELSPEDIQYVNSVIRDGLSPKFSSYRI